MNKLTSKLLATGVLILSIGISIPSFSKSENDYFSILNNTAKFKTSEKFLYRFSEAPSFKQLNGAPVATIKPSIAGIWTMLNDTDIQFLPTQSCQDCTKYTVSFNPNITNKTGKKKLANPNWEFESSRLSFENAEKTDEGLKLEFSSYISPADLSKYLVITDENKNKIQWTTKNKIISKIVSISLPKEKKSRVIDCTVKKGMMPANGTLGIMNDETKSVKYYNEFIIEELDANQDEDQPVLRLKASCGGIDKDAKNFISVKPDVKYDVSIDYNAIELRGDFQENVSYEVTVNKGLMATSKLYTQTIKEPITLTTTVPKKKPSLIVKAGGGWMSNKGSMSIPITTNQLSGPLTVEAFRVFDNNFAVYAATGENAEAATTWGTKVATTTQTLSANFSVDLKKLLGADAAGVYCIKFTANKGDESGYTKTPDEGREYIYSGSETISAQTLIVMTNLSIVAKYGKDKVTAWVGDMETAKPVAGAEVMIYSKTNQQLASAQTDENGLVSFSGISADMKNGRYIAKAIKGQDMAYLQLSDTQSWSEQFPGEGNEYIPVDSTRAYVTTERGAYRPGEDVHILALLRDRQGNAPKTPIPVQIKLVNPRYSSKDIGTFTCDSLGCVETTYSLAASAFTGHYSIELSLPEKSTQYETDIMGSASISHNSIGWLGKTSFLVEEFIANRLRVNAAFPEKFYTKADDLKMTVKAEEMFGAPATGRRITASAEFSLAQFVSKNFKDFTFSNLFDEKDSVSKELGEANADAKGNAVFKIENPMISPNGQTKIAVQTTVYDSGRGITVEDSTIFDTAPYHIGIAKLDDGFVELNKPKTFQFVTVDPKTDNLTTTATNSKATVEVFREQWNSVMKRSGSGYQYEAKLELTPMGSGNIQFADNKASWEFTPSVAGMYRIKVTSEDKKDCSVAKFTASSGEWKSYQPWSMEKPEDVEVSFDRPSYKIGDEARVLIKSPFKGTALIGFEQDTPLDVKVFPMDSNTLEVPVKVTKDFAPMTWVSVTVLRPVNPEPKWLPHRAVGYADIRINSEYCQANVDLQLPETVLPGDKLRFKAQVTETNTSAPIAGAEVYLWGVDEGILTLTDFKLENPIDWLFGKYCLMVDTADFYSRLVEDILADNKNATGGDGEANTARFKNSNENKKRVKNVVYWLGKFDTNSSGTIDAELTTPRNFNGSMTMMAVVSTPERIGSAQKNVSVRAPLIIQNNAPRFLATGDKARIAYTLFNTTDTTNTATLNFAAEGIIDIEQKVVSSEPIAPNSSIEVFVDLSTKDNALGEGTITCDGTMGENKASDSVTIPVRPVAPRIPWGSLTIAKASDGNKPINLMSVGNIIPETFLLDLNAGPVAAAQLNGAIKNNLEYPYGCCEQTISRALPFLAIEKAGLAEKIGYNGVFVRDIVQKTIDRLSLYESPRTNLMTAWPGVGDDNLFVSAYALFFLCEARDAGYKIQDDKLKEMAITLSNRSNDDNNKDFMDLSGNSKAFIYYAIVRSKAVDNRKLRKKLSDTADALSPAGQAWLASALHIEGQEELAKTVMAKAVADAGKDINTLNADATGQECFFSNEREIAVPLWACATNSTLTSNTDTLDILSMNLNKLNTNGNWQNTQANAWAVMALAAYESLNKNAGAQDSKGLLLVNGKEYPFDAQKPLKLTNKDINCTDTVTLSVSGEGKAAVAVSASAIPLDIPSATTVGGLALSRQYLKMDGTPVDVKTIKQGDLIKVRLTMKAKNTVENIAVQDLLPAGFEIENSNLSTSYHAESKDDDDNDSKNCWNEDYTQNSDDRFLAFGSIETTGLATETAVVEYIARAVTVGEFAIPPAQAEAMYNPNSIMARTDAGKMIINKR